jgi:3'(2'), 5'-bisphosphate nucleotidase
MDDMTLLDLAMDLARRAGDVILEVRRRGFETIRKADHSPVTEADHAAERLIAAGLRAACPAIPVVAEEEIAAGHVPEHDGVYWLVDPLDGTREFAVGSDSFAVCIGLVRHGRAVLGAVGAPVEGAVFGGVVGVGACKQDAAGRRAIAARTVPPGGIDVMASRHYADDPRLAPFLGGRSVASVTHIGSALKFCRVAEGRADLYPRFGRTMEWDTAAAQALVEAAGGQVLGMQDRLRLGYGKPGWENTSFVCTGRV